ncbi:hypothetical protein [Afifella aestuarii]|uniref:hypothetical protein n=1 Tax=Afifella aestuarii TaxID=1909496 RepID=UPI000FE3B990|nr:hypothetical protein [Afifella aestuarii]
MPRRIGLILAMAIALSTMSGVAWPAEGESADFRIPPPEGMCQLDPDDSGLEGEVYNYNREKMARSGNFLIALFFPCEMLEIENLADQPDVTPHWVIVYSQNMIDGELVKSPLTLDQALRSMENAFRDMNVAGSRVNSRIEDVIKSLDTGVSFETGPLTEIVESDNPAILYVKLFTRAKTEKKVVDARSVIAFTQVGGFDVSIATHMTNGSNDSYVQLIRQAREMAEAMRAGSTFPTE